MDRKSLLNILLLAALVILLMQHCGVLKQLDTANSGIASMKVERKLLYEGIDKQGRHIAEQKVLIIENKKAAEKHLEQVNGIKKKNIIYQAQNETKTTVKNVNIPLVNNNNSKPDSCRDDSLLKHLCFTPQFALDTPGFKINLTLHPGYNLKLDSLSITDLETITIGNKRPKWYKKPEQIVNIRHSNPLIRTTGLSIINQPERKRFYDKHGFWFIIGAVGGVFLL